MPSTASSTPRTRSIADGWVKNGITSPSVPVDPSASAARWPRAVGEIAHRGDDARARGRAHLAAVEYARNCARPHARPRGDVRDRGPSRHRVRQCTASLLTHLPRDVRLRLALEAAAVEAPHGRCGRECRCRRSRSSAPARRSSPATCQGRAVDARAGGRHDVRADGHRRGAAARVRAGDAPARRRARVEATLDRRAALDGADYVMTLFQVGGLRRRRSTSTSPPLRAEPDDRRHARRRRDLPRPADDAGPARPLPRHGGAVPRALLLQYINPMAMLCWAVARASPFRASASATACSTPPGGWPPTSACPPRSSTTTWPASTTWRSSWGSARQRGPLPGAAGSPRRARARRQPRALRGDAPARATLSRSPRSTSPSTCPGSSSPPGRS